MVTVTAMWGEPTSHTCVTVTFCGYEFDFGQVLTDLKGLGEGMCSTECHSS